MRFGCPAAGVKKSRPGGCTTRDSGLLLTMGDKRVENEQPTFEELKAELDAAIAELQAAFVSGDDGSVSSLNSRVRAIESELKTLYYSRWGIP